MLEVTGDERTLWPDTAALVEAARVLVKEGFVVLPTRRATRSSAAGSRTRAARRSSDRRPRRFRHGDPRPNALSILIEQAQVPVVVDAGVGTASDATIAMELGADGVFLNAAVAGARHPIRMAEAMRDAVKAAEPPSSPGGSRRSATRRLPGSERPLPLSGPQDFPCIPEKTRSHTR